MFLWIRTPRLHPSAPAKNEVPALRVYSTLTTAPVRLAPAASDVVGSFALAGPFGPATRFRTVHRTLNEDERLTKLGES